MLRSLNTYSTYNAEDNKLKIPAFEVLTHLQDPSDLKKNSSSSSAITNLTSSGTTSGVTIDPDLDYEIWISDFTIEHEIRKQISLLVLMINFISQNLKISPTPTPLGTNHTNKQVCYNVHCTVIKTLKRPICKETLHTPFETHRFSFKNQIVENSLKGQKSCA